MANLVYFSPVHADDIEEGFAVDIEAGASSATLLKAAVGVLRLLAERRGGDQRGSPFSEHRRLQVSLAAHDRGKCGSKVSAGIAVIRQSKGHEQGAQVGVTETQWPVIVGVANDRFGR